MSTFKTVVFPMDVYVWGMIAVVAVAMMATLFALSKTGMYIHIFIFLLFLYMIKQYPTAVFFKTRTLTNQGLFM